MASSSKASHLTKWREISRTCDACLSRQTYYLGDGRDVPGHHCSACLGARRKCTYVQLHKALEEQLRTMETLLHNTQQHAQNAGDAADANKGPNIERSNETIFPPRLSSQKTSSVGKTSSSSTATLSHNILNILQADDFSDDPKHLQANKEYTALAGLSLDNYLDGTSLLSDVIELKYGAGPGIGSQDSFTSANLTSFPNRRLEFWESQKWEQNALPSPHQVTLGSSYVFPDEDLLDTLVQRYFEDANWILPVLHRPTFEVALANNMHLTDDGFARVVLLVCAIGSAYLDDRRVLTDSSSGRWHKAGVRWFEQVMFNGHAVITHPSLYDLQVYCLASIFLHTSPEPHVLWTLMSMGIRLAQEIGIHRRKVYTGSPNAFDEEWKRAFWVLFILDIWTAWFLGRPRAMRDEDIDVELPVEVDDDYWYHSDPARCFEQPPGKPSYMAGFNQMIAVMRILGVALRILYSAKRSRPIHGQNGPNWDDSHAKQLSLALDEWQAKLPAHLHWDAKQSNLQWFRQSTLLRCCFCHGQLIVFRPFLPRKVQKLGMQVDENRTSALHILESSTLAARSFANTICTHFSRTSDQSPLHINAAFQAGMSLLFNLWTRQRFPPMEVEEIRADAEHVNHCMEVLKICETRWPLAGKYRDLLDELSIDNSGASFLHIQSPP